MTLANPVADQYEAAARDASERMNRVAQLEDYEISHTGEVTSRIARDYIKHSESHAQHCEHTVESPQVVFGAAALPGIICCAECFTQVFSAYAAMHMSHGFGRPCDGCGEMAKSGKTGVLQYGPLILTVSLCETCVKRDED